MLARLLCSPLGRWCESTMCYYGTISVSGPKVNVAIRTLIDGRVHLFTELAASWNRHQLLQTLLSWRFSSQPWGSIVFSGAFDAVPVDAGGEI